MNKGNGCRKKPFRLKSEELFESVRPCGRGGQDTLPEDRTADGVLEDTQETGRQKTSWRDGHDWHKTGRCDADWGRPMPNIDLFEVEEDFCICVFRYLCLCIYL
ncbi:uncharacterized protein LOC125037202 [Penaeus chinensis]|uniref:uncharacterized protein LOC125037202 n=1 Tax=Penaeus chinensis TaxID=139456 RepID=UPI001FB819A6|nr:uncharacterized protein LOC125037202 [Penaeus chinensis]